MDAEKLTQAAGLSCCNDDGCSFARSVETHAAQAGFVTGTGVKREGPKMVRDAGGGLHLVGSAPDVSGVPMDRVTLAGNVLQGVCHHASETAGWWRNYGVDLRELCRKADSMLGKALVAQKLMLIVSEVSEAMEGHRKGLQDDKLPHRPMLEVELADAVIRICDLAGALNLDLGGAIAEKLAFNAVRPDHKPEARQAAGGKAY